MDENKDKACQHSLLGIYQPRHPENTVLYHVFQKYLETWITQTQEEGGYVPSHVEKDFRKYLECGLLCHGFARARCTCGHEYLVAFSCKGHGICPSCNARQMVETTAHLVDHVFPKAPVRQWVLEKPFINKILLLLDGVYKVDDYGKMRFHRIKAPELQELTQLVHTISHRVARFLERRGLLERDDEDSYLTLDCLDDEPMQQLHGT